jgi:hypothetical protein
MTKKKDEKKELTFSDVILMQEAAGQATFVNSTTLPKEGLTEPGILATRKPFVPEGIIIKDDVDDLFVNVELPKGWTKKANPGHSMWSYLLDEQGRCRAGIFYKAAFYDRNARISWDSRYNVCTRYLDDMGERVQIIVTDATVGVDTEAGEGPVLWESAVITDYSRRPDWLNPALYWDDTEVPS